MRKKEAIAALKDSNNERALLYMSLYRELKKRHGRSEAIDVMRTALYRHGGGFGKTLKSFAPDDFDGLYDAFALAPDGGAMFSPKKVHCDQDCLQIHFMTCPLQKAWRNAGVEDEELAILLYCASALDEGTMNVAGFDLDIQTWKPGETGCCKLKVTKRQG
jgi:hypothetical protein